MINHKQLWVLAGGNGVGKSTFYHTRLEPLGLTFINADILAKQVFPHASEKHSYDAAIIAAQMRNQLLRQGQTFCFETVFSHPSKIDFIAQAKAQSYEIILVFIHLKHITLNLARVSQRVSEGGHTVPENKIISRVPRVLKLIKQSLVLCDEVYLLDNSRLDNPFQQIATINHGKLKTGITPLPDWAEWLLKNHSF